MTGLKSIVLCLALANAGYFLWVNNIAKSQDAAATEAPAATLKLASEAAEAPRTADGGGGGIVGTSGGRDAQDTPGWTGPRAC